MRIAAFFACESVEPPTPKTPIDDGVPTLHNAAFNRYRMHNLSRDLHYVLYACLVREDHDPIGPWDMAIDVRTPGIPARPNHDRFDFKEANPILHVVQQMVFKPGEWIPGTYHAKLRIRDVDASPEWQFEVAL